MVYRTKTYIAGDWTGDSDAIQQLYNWKDGNRWGLDFHDAHDLQQARDTSLNCSIKSSLATRLDASKTFVLIVGNGTETTRSGSCQYCESYNSMTRSCARGSNVDYRSYIEYECDKAIRDGLNIVVLYNAATTEKFKCPDAVRYVGSHTPMQYIVNGTYEWNYSAVKTALG
ncbi:MAG: hypothetical protein Ta2B_30780 [Termitinemataceae bacterium]|nr:MAG: hypothetical protein Ta2B_30780 [Termitinemataceae bacterium]